MQEQTHIPFHFVPLQLISRLRWLSLFGQISVIFILHFIGIIMPITPLLIILSVSFCVALTWQFYKKHYPQKQISMLPNVLLYDFFHVALLLFFTGGLFNPFMMLLLGPILLISSFHTMKHLCTVLISGSLVVAFLYITPYPLPWFDSGLVFDPLLRFAAALCLWGSILFYGSYLFYSHHYKEKLRLRLAFAEHNLAEHQKIGELGLMAAACAHELGTPLGTILITAQDITHDTHAPQTIKDDAALIVSQTKRCRDILKQLGTHYKQSSSFHIELIHFLKSIFGTYPFEGQFHIQNNLKASYLLENNPDLSLAFGNLFQNAIRFATNTITLTLDYSDTKSSLLFHLHDDGPGFDPFILMYLNGMTKTDDGILPHSNKNEHLGIGLFITKKLFDKNEIQLTFSNENGAVCRVMIPMKCFEPMTHITTSLDYRDTFHDFNASILNGTSSTKNSLDSSHFESADHNLSSRSQGVS